MRRVWLSTLTVFLLTGCSQSPEQAAKEAKQVAGSWGATLSAAERARSTGEISTAFFNAIVTQALTSLKTEAQTARKSGGDAAAAPLDEVAARAARLR
jgi:uncharacterized protein YcfL